MAVRIQKAEIKEVPMGHHDWSAMEIWGKGDLETEGMQVQSSRQGIQEDQKEDGSQLQPGAF